jgi:hypothetical protein
MSELKLRPLEPLLTTRLLLIAQALKRAQSEPITRELVSPRAQPKMAVPLFPRRCWRRVKAKY